MAWIRLACAGDSVPPIAQPYDPTESKERAKMVARIVLNPVEGIKHWLRRGEESAMRYGHVDDDNHDIGKQKGYQCAHKRKLKPVDAVARHRDRCRCAHFQCRVETLLMNVVRTMMTKKSPTEIVDEMKKKTPMTSSDLPPRMQKLLVSSSIV
eukprot:CAMPEP_0115884206 /NCGR_PEP_ID=MMETSP0287-20121206/29992_1 /TAXON_ID=412157 /ORGANISM="Chrysochromulina rotalis, Strain UIO044" /LENGTH=152 /DNA_ID=CAMNT_0003340491 /DNA_START=898 /DNA_END=1356 /DNA_ORIENTATION=-